jgi:hypothetical protein
MTKLATKSCAVIASKRVGAERRPFREAIQGRKQDWIASSQGLLAMTNSPAGVSSS